MLVTHEPGDWFEETLRALAAQDYRNLRVMVVDTGSSVDPSSRVTAILPEAAVHLVDRGVGFGEAANQVFDRIDEADLLLFCHDDVAPEPGAIRAMVEIAAVSGAGIVGPKLVHWDDPRRLLQVGALVDKTGASLATVEPGELDQGQQDGLREVFQVPGAFTLVRAGLFSRIGGFDEQISLLADDLSLCWRARVAGAMVVVTSSARVRHRESLGQRLPERRRRCLIRRHRLRVALTSYSRAHLWRVLPQLMLASFVEMVLALLILKPSRVMAAASAWTWNLRHPIALFRARQHVREFRKVGDKTVRQLQVRGLMRTNMLARRISTGLRPRTMKDRFERLSYDWDSSSVLMTLALASVLLMGSRHLLTRGVPAVGHLASFDSPDVLWGDWLAGWHSAGFGSDVVPSGLAVFGALGALLQGHVEILRVMATLGLLPLGLLGMARLLRRLGSFPSVCGTVAYGLLPLPYTALAAGRWSSLAVYAAAPWLLGRLAYASGAVPFTAESPRAAWLSNTMLLGMLTALLGIFVPAAPVLVVGLALALALGSLLAFELKGGLRVVTAGLVAAVVAVLLHLPWALDVVDLGWSGTLATMLGSPDRGLELTHLLGFDAGTPFETPLIWGLALAAALPVLVGRGWRLSWAVRGWLLTATAWALAWLHSRGDVELPLPDTQSVLMLGGCGVALAVGMATVTVEFDVAGRSRRFGLRRALTAVAFCGVVVAAVPVSLASLDGYWNMPRGDFAGALGFVGDEVVDSSRILWLGSPDVLPVPGHELRSSAPERRGAGGDVQLGGDVEFAATTGLPRLHDLWVTPPDVPSGEIETAMDKALTQQTARLGELLAPMAIEFIVVPQRLAPSRFTPAVHASARPALGEALAGQLDLERIDLDPGVLVYRNKSYVPGLAAVPSSADLDAGDVRNMSIESSKQRAFPVLHEEGRSGARSGVVPSDVTVLQSANASDRWKLEVEGEPAPRRTVFGWANAFDVQRGGSARLEYDTPSERRLLLAMQGGLWVVVLALVGVGIWLSRRPPKQKQPDASTASANGKAAKPRLPVEESVRVIDRQSADERVPAGIGAP